MWLHLLALQAPPAPAAGLSFPLLAAPGRRSIAVLLELSVSGHTDFSPPAELVAPAPCSDITPQGVRHIRQRTLGDCGVAAVAMLAEVGYDRAASVHPPERRGGGLQAMDLAIMLRRLTGRLVRLSGAAEGRMLQEYALGATGPAIVLIHEQGSLRGHFVVVSDGVVLDPELPSAAAIDSYPHRDWNIFRVLTLENAAIQASAA